MASTWKKLTYFAFNLPNRPGELARFTAQLRDAGIDLLGLWGYADGLDNPRISCVPVDAPAFRVFMQKGTVAVEEGQTFYLSDANRAGALVETLQRVADEGINIDTIECVAGGAEFGCFIWSAEADWAGLERLLT